MNSPSKVFQNYQKKYIERKRNLEIQIVRDNKHREIFDFVTQNESLDEVVREKHHRETKRLIANTIEMKQRLQLKAAI